MLGGGDVPSDDVLDLLAGLVDKSLVLVDRYRAETRFDMYETIRQYAEERLVAAGDAEAVRARHGQWAAAFARVAGRGLYSPDERTWVNRLRDEIDNLQAAVGWAVAAGDTDVAMRIGASFVRQPVEHPLLGTAHLSENAARRLRAPTFIPCARRLPTRRGVCSCRVAENERSSCSRHRCGHKTRRAVLDGHVYVCVDVRGVEGAFDPYEMARTGLERPSFAGDVFGEIGMRIAYAATARLFDDADEAIVHADRVAHRRPPARSPDARSLGPRMRTGSPGAPPIPRRPSDSCTNP